MQEVWTECKFHMNVKKKPIDIYTKRDTIYTLKSSQTGGENHTQGFKH